MHTCKVNVVLQSCEVTAFLVYFFVSSTFYILVAWAVKVGPFIIVLVMQTSFILLPFIIFPQKDLGVHFTMKSIFSVKIRISLAYEHCFLISLVALREHRF